MAYTPLPNPWKNVPYVGALIDALQNWAAALVTNIAVRKEGAAVGTRPALNFIDGDNIALTVADDAGDDEVEVTVSVNDSTAVQFADLILYDTFANQPGAGIEGRLFYSTDTEALYRDNGVTWDTLTIDDSGLQPLDATLTALAAQNWAANAVPLGTGTDTVSQLAMGASTVLARLASGDVVAATPTEIRTLLGTTTKRVAVAIELGSAYYEDAITTIKDFTIQIGNDYTGGDVTVTFLGRAGVGTNAIVLRRDLYRWRDGAAYTQVETTENWNWSPAVATPNMVARSFAIADANVNAGDSFRLDVTRLGADGGDTNTSYFNVDAAYIEYTGGL